MKRRDFLKSAITSGTVLGAGTLAGCKNSNDQETADESKFKSQTLLPFNPDAPETLPNGVTKKVLVIGGGIAGLSSALKLAERGYSVTLREAAPYLGGRLHTRTETLKTGTFNIEHGLHMWFYQYYNFEGILKDLGVWEKNFRDFNEVFFTFKDYEDEVIKSTGAYPLNLLNIVKDSPNLSMLNALQTFRALPDIIFYNHKNHFAKFDNLNFFDWAKDTGVNKKFFDVIMEPAASVTLNDPEKISASEMILNMHFYFIGHPKAFQRKITKIDHGSAVIAPWAERLKALGTNIQLSSPVQGLSFQNGKCTGVLGEKDIYDHVVISSDVGASKYILNSSKATDSQTANKLGNLVNKVSGLKIAPTYHVLRVWLDKPIASKLTQAQAVIETPQHPPINLLGVFEMLEEESRVWAEKTGGSIIEFHLYNTPEFASLTKEQVWNQIRDQAIDCFAQTDAHDLMKSANPLDFSLGRFNNFTSFEPGQAQHKPLSYEGRLIGIDNLFFAGDWVQFDSFPNALMERAVSTGIEAANGILLKDGVRQVAVKGANPNGPGIFPRF